MRDLSRPNFAVSAVSAKNLAENPKNWRSPRDSGTRFLDVCHDDDHDDDEKFQPASASFSHSHWIRLRYLTLAPKV